MEKFSHPLINVMSRKTPIFLIAEVGMAHDGSLGSAHAYIDAVARAGVTAVKFQTHIASAESSQDERFRTNCFVQDRSRYDYWKRTEFTVHQWRDLKEHARERGLEFLSTPFSTAAVDLLREIDISIWKVSSGDTNNLPLIEYIAKDGRQILLSTGMSTYSEIEQAVLEVRKCHDNIGILQCTTQYPTRPRDVGLNVMIKLKELYGYPVGLSDHSGSIYPSIVAAALGADIIEVHVVFSKDCFGPDVSSSLTVTELGELSSALSHTREMLVNPVDKDIMSTELSDLKVLFGKGMYASTDIASGSTLSQVMVELKKPADGIPAARLSGFIGRRLSSAKRQGEKFFEDDFE